MTDAEKLALLADADALLKAASMKLQIRYGDAYGDTATMRYPDAESALLVMVRSLRARVGDVK